MSYHLLKLVLIYLSLSTTSLSQSVSVKGCTNTATSRQCWLPNFDINTNYYQRWPNTGVLREYWLTVENTTIAPDGFETQALLFNGTLPGPTIRVNWGDRVRIHITNNLENNGTDTHWHGIRQYHTNMYDGTAGLTESPIAPGTTNLYEFTATQYGSSWYHSHFSVQYGAGLWGPLIIDGPATANYDVDLGPLIINDWAHQDVFALLESDNDAGHPSGLAGALVNGTNKFPGCQGAARTHHPECISSGSRFNTTIESGKKYRLRLVNAAVQSFFKVVIDNHNFTVIANDFVPVEPSVTDNIVFGPGQRYDIILTADQPIGNYWFRGIYQDCFITNLNNPGNTLGIIHYAGAPQANPKTKNPYTKNHTCPDFGLLQHGAPHLAIDVGTPSQTELVSITQSSTQFLYLLNGASFLADWAYPTMYQVYIHQKNLSYYTNGSYLNHNDTPPRLQLDDIYNGTVYAAENIIKFNGKNKWVYVILNSTVSEFHPIHLHGHDFYVLSQGQGGFVPGVSPLNTQNPTRRDTAVLVAYGHLVLAWRTDNPGAWILHCHIAWHVSLGFAVQFLEREDEILQYYNITRVVDLRAKWLDYIPHQYHGQDDSGF